MSPRAAVILSILVAILSWAGLAAMVNYLPPQTLHLAVALPLTVVAVGSLCTPLWMAVQRRVTPEMDDATLVGTALRQGLWTGLFVATLLTLRIFRVLDWVLVLVAAALFIMLEVFIQQRRQWQQMRKRSGKRDATATTKTSASSRTPGGQAAAKAGALAASFGRAAPPKSKAKKTSKTKK